MGIKSGSKKRVIRMVIDRRFREGNVERNSNMITSSLGSTMNGVEPINGMSPNDFKKTMDVAGDLVKQQTNSSIASPDTAMQHASPPTASNPQNQPGQATPPIVDPNSDLGKALNGQQSNLDLSKVPDDQKNMLLQTMMATGMQQK
jgi:hypothetical protein